MPPESCLSWLCVLIEPAEGQTSGGAWAATAAAVLFRRPRMGWRQRGQNRSCGGNGAGPLHIGRDALCDSARRSLHRLSRQVGVASRRLHLPVAKQFPDHRQTLPQGQCPRSEAVSEVMNPHVFQTRTLANPASLRIRSQHSLMFRCPVPFFLPGNTHGLPSTGERPLGTFAAGGGNGTTRAPVLLSCNRISPASKSRSSHRSPRTSRCACTRSAPAAGSPRPRGSTPAVRPVLHPAPAQPVQFLRRQEPLVVLLHLVAADEPTRVSA